MIQRVQSIFLFLAAISGFGALGFPFYTVSSDSTSSTIFADGKFTASDSTSLIAAFAISGLLLAGAIFLFRNRPVQLKMTYAGMLGSLVGGGLLTYFLYQETENFSGQPTSFGIGLFLPILALVCGFLAARGIKKDEALVRSSERLR